MSRARIAYSNKDYESLRKELLARVPQLTERWTDFNASDLGVVLLELFCGVGDMLAYYLDAQANEAFLPTVRQRQNLINLCKLIGYRVAGPVAATTELRFTVKAALEFELAIHAGTLCKASLEDGEVFFVTAAEARVAPGDLTALISARQGRPKTEASTGTGLPGQRLALASTSIAEDTIRAIIGGDLWTAVGHFQETDPDSRHFILETDGLDRSSLLFGDGRRGRIPEAGAQIAVEFLETLGAGGNIGRGLVTEIVTPVTRNGITIALDVTNTIPATGGADRESMDFARAQAPAELTTLWKAVTKADYKALAEGFPGVAKAQVLDVNDCRNIRYYQVNMAVAPHGGGLPSPLLMGELQAFLEARKVITIEINLFDPAYRPIAIDAEVFGFAGEDLPLLRGRAETALREFLAFERVTFGMSVYFSDLVALLDGVSGVSHVRIREPRADVVLRPGEIPLLGPLNLVMKRAT